MTENRSTGVEIVVIMTIYQDNFHKHWRTHKLEASQFAGGHVRLDRRSRLDLQIPETCELESKRGSSFSFEPVVYGR